MSLPLTSAKSASINTEWTTQPQAWELIRSIVDQATNVSPVAASLAKRMYAETGTRLIDWIDHILLPENHPAVAKLKTTGYQQGDQDTEYHHPGGVLPPILIKKSGPLGLAIKIENVADFAAIYGSDYAIEGLPLAVYRTLRIQADDKLDLFGVERHGYRGYTHPKFDASHAVLRMKYLEAFRTRKRDFATDVQGFDEVLKLIDSAQSAGLDTGVICDLFFAAEREFWMRRNRAAQVQYTRQQRLGLGWANHDHHTYRSSRANFVHLVRVWERLGFIVRERFYAGAEAGWGAQVMEQAQTGIITFNDVDLTPDELQGDFAHEPLSPQPKLGTVGLWCGLHGDSFLQAGMHHLECQFDFDALRQQLESEHAVKVMKPFTDFPHLRQAFTEGERWRVSEARIARLEKDGLITADQGTQFRQNGALGSHLENLERNDGFKGFNQTGVSQIIAATDPRRHSH